MEVVVDTNILFSALISGKAAYLDIFRAAKIYSPDFIFLEIAKYEERIIKRTRAKESFQSFAKNLFSQMTVIPKLAISSNSFSQAYEFCQDIDEKDTPFLALSIELTVPLWTNDKVLINGLREKKYSNIVSNDEMFDLLT